MTPIKQGYVVEQNITGDPENELWSPISVPLGTMEDAIEFTKNPLCVGASYLRIVLVYETLNSER